MRFVGLQTARLVLTLVGLNTKRERVPLSMVSLQLFDATRTFRNGRWALRCWPVHPRVKRSGHGAPDPAIATAALLERVTTGVLHPSPPAPQALYRLTTRGGVLITGVCAENTIDDASPVVVIELESFLLPVRAPTPDFVSLSGGVPPEPRTDLSSIDDAALVALLRRGGGLWVLPWLCVRVYVSPVGWLVGWFGWLLQTHCLIDSLDSAQGTLTFCGSGRIRCEGGGSGGACCC